MKLLRFGLILFIFINSLPLQAQQNTLLIDGFEDPNPYNNYQLSKGDQSGLSLNASSDKKNGKYSLEMVYYLKSTLPTGTYVSIVKYFDEENQLNLKDLLRFSLSVKGDGSGNLFKLEIIDGSDEVWVYENKNVLNSTRWENIIINLSDLSLSEEGPKNNKVFDVENIKGYRITLYNTYSKTVQGQAVKASQGSVLLDDLTAILKGIVEKPVEEKEVKRAEEPSPINLSGSLYGELFHVPDKANQLYGTTGKKIEAMHWGKVNIDANYGNVSGKIVLASEAQEFGNAAYRENENDFYTGQVHQNYPQAIIPFIQLRLNNLSEFIGNITIGNLWFEYSRYTFSPTLGYDDIWGVEKVMPDWGYKGASVEGSLQQIINYHTFIIKHPYESYTYGLRLNRRFGKFKAIEMDSVDIKLYYVDSEDTAKFTNEDTIKKSGHDKVYSGDLAARFLKGQIGLEAMYAFNDYLKQAQVDYNNPYQPIYQQALDQKVDEKDSAYKAKLIFDSLLLNSLILSYEYRRLGENFKPKNRMEPITFDDIDSDQTGHNALASYRIFGFNLTGEFDELTRISNKDYYRKRRSAGLGTSQFKNIYIFYLYEWKREIYKYTSMRSSYHTERNDEIVTQEIYFKAQLRYNFDLILKLRNEDIEWPTESKEFNNQSVYVKSNYYYSNNLLFFAETRISRFGDNSWYSPGYDPFIDNFVRIGTMFNF